MFRQDTKQTALIARHHELVDLLWKQHTICRIDPAKYFPREIVEHIFKFVVYHMEPGDWWGRSTLSGETIAGWQGGPLVLTSVSRKWCQIAATYPPFWSTILIDQSEEDCLERIHLFLDRSGKELLEIVLLCDGTPRLPFRDFLMNHAERFKTFVVLSATGRAVFPSQMEIPKSLAPFVNWNIQTFRHHTISTVPIPKCVRHLELPWTYFDSRSLIPFTSLHSLRSLSTYIHHEPNDAQWDKKLRFEVLQYLYLDISCHKEIPSTQFTSQSLSIDWLECPALMNLNLSWDIAPVTCDEIYAYTEAWLLKLRSLQKLRVYIGIYQQPALGIRQTDLGLKAVRLQNMQHSTFNGSLELVDLRFCRKLGDTEWGMACTERFFSVFTPHTHLVWLYGQFPSPAIFTHLKTVHITDEVEWHNSVLVPLGMTQMEFPLLEELYLVDRMHREPPPLPPLLDLLHAPHLKSLHIHGFIPLDLRHISNSTISSVSLTITWEYEGPREGYLPCDCLHLELPVNDLFQLNVHPSLNQCVTIKTTWQDVSCPPNWTMDYVSEMLGTVTVLTVDTGHFIPWHWSPPEAILPFLRPFVFLKCLKLFCCSIGEATCIDQLAQHLPDPNFLPALEALLIAEYPSWPDFFQSIQQRQIGFLTGQFQTALREVTIKGHVHGALLEHLRASLAGKYIGLFNMPPRRKGSKDWPVPPFSSGEVDTNGLLCCYICQRAGLEIGCMVVHSGDGSKMVECVRAQGEFGRELNKVFAP
jgi:hypothetical protein